MEECICIPVGSGDIPTPPSVKREKCAGALVGRSWCPALKECQMADGMIWMVWIVILWGKRSNNKKRSTSGATCQRSSSSRKAPTLPGTSCMKPKEVLTCLLRWHVRLLSFIRRCHIITYFEGLWGRLGTTTCNCRFLWAYYFPLIWNIKLMFSILPKTG